MADKKDNSLFDILGALFNNKDYINNLPDQAMNSNYFMINRRLAINYPLQAQVFNHNKINPKDVIKFWSDYLYTGGRCPGWIYTPGAAKSKAKNESKHKITNAQIEKYAITKGINKKSIETAIELFGDKMIDEILEYEKIINNINK